MHLSISQLLLACLELAFILFLCVYGFVFLIVLLFNCWISNKKKLQAWQNQILELALINNNNNNNKFPIRLFNCMVQPAFLLTQSQSLSWMLHESVFFFQK